MTILIRDLSINEIRVKEPHRPIDEKKLVAIKDSMAEIGLKTAITVRARKNGPVLIAGLHRLKAAKALGWKEIPCVIIDCKKVDADLWGLAENLHRAELTAIQRSEFIKEWEKLLKERPHGARVCAPWRQSAPRQGQQCNRESPRHVAGRGPSGQGNRRYFAESKSSRQSGGAGQQPVGAFEGGEGKIEESANQESASTRARKGQRRPRLGQS